MLGPFILTLVRFVIASVYACSWRRECRPHAWLFAASTLLRLDTLISVVGVWRQSNKLKWHNNPLDQAPPLAAKRDGMALSMQDTQFLVAFTQALPQCFMQGYVLLVLRLDTGNISTGDPIVGWMFAVQVASFLLSVLNISVTVAFVRIMWQQSPRSNLLCWLNIIVWTTCEVSNEATSPVPSPICSPAQPSPAQPAPATLC